MRVGGGRGVLPHDDARGKEGVGQVVRRLWLRHVRHTPPSYVCCLRAYTCQRTHMPYVYALCVCLMCMPYVQA